MEAGRQEGEQYGSDAVDIDSLLNQWRQDALPTLDGRVARLFDAAADVMLEFAEKAQNDHLRGRFYEALREIRLNRDQVSEHFMDGLSRGLFRFDASRGPSPPGRDEVLQLVDPDDFERGLALQMMAEQAERDHATLFLTLPLRLAAISGSRPVPLEDIPAGPRQTTAQFATSSTLLQIEHEARLALYTLFERFVMPTSVEVITRLDSRLSQAGVLPDLHLRAPAAATTPQPGVATAPSSGATRGSEPAPGGPLGDETLLRIRDLLSARRARRQPHPGAATGAVPPAPVGEVLAAITELPGSPAPAPGQADQPGAAPVSPQDLRDLRQSLFDQRSRLRARLGEERVSPDIDDVIEIVGAIFEMMLNEKNLPDAVKSLLSHLHTPYLKYAVSEPDLLADPKHPARQWLDDLVRAGSDWVDPADLTLGLYPWMADAVLQLTRARRQDRPLYEQLQRALHEQLNLQNSRQQKLERRAGEHARGKARLDQAQDLGQTALDKLLAGHPGGPLAADFLEETWINYLVLLLLRANNDDQTPEVRGAMTLGRDICDTCVQVARDHAHAGGQIQRLEKALQLTIGELIPHLEPKVRGFIAALKNNQLTRGREVSTPGSGKRGDIRRPVHQPITLTRSEQKIAERLKKLPPGTRFWRRSATSETDTTLRLVWFNPQTMHFMFADLAGQQAGMVDIKALVSDVTEGRARVLEEHSQSFMEKALHTFQALLKQGL